MGTVWENYKEIALVINEYVKNHGTNDCKTNAQIKDLLLSHNINLHTMYQPSDLCYNRTTKNDVAGFANAIHLFEYVGRNNYRILGEGFPYNGIIERKPKGKKDSIIIGEWRNGVCKITEKNKI